MTLSFTNFATNEPQEERLSGTILTDHSLLIALRQLLTNISESRLQDRTSAHLSDDLNFDWCESDDVVTSTWQQLVRLSWRISAVSKVETMFILDQTVLEIALSGIEAFLAEPDAQQ
jgi:hypothetical protein